MFNQKIDVAAIMREIKATVAPEQSFSENEGGSGNMPELTDARREILRIHDFIDHTREDMSPYLDMGMRIPGFNKFNILVRKAFRFIARLIRKATRHIAKEQSVVNHNTDACLKALVESEQTIFDLISGVAVDNRQLQEQNQRLQMQSQQLQEQSQQLQMQSQQLQMQSQQLQEQLLLLQTQNQRFQAENLQFRKQLDLDEDAYDLYLEFENKFRGEMADIKNRVSYYLDNYVAKCVRSKENDKIIDLGCGRGEWVELLKENGYNAAGVDLNESMVNECKVRGLDVVLDDAISYLKALENNSVQVVTAFQLVEHLSSSTMKELIRECQRVLKPHGIAILETPNGANLEVGANNFYIDPTHIRPVHKDYLEFLAQAFGFYDTEITYWKKEEIESWWESVVSADETSGLDSTSLRTVAESVKNALYVSPDYALIATK